MTLSALAEMASLGAIVPFLALLASPQGEGFELPFFKLQLTIADASILFAAVVALSTLVRVVTQWHGNKLTLGTGADLAREVFHRTLSQPYAWHVGRNSSDVLASVNKVGQVVAGVLNPLTQGAIAVLSSVGIIVALAIIDFETASLAAGIVGGLYLVVSIVVRRQISRNGRVVSENENRRIKAIQEGLGGIRDVIMDGSGPYFTDIFDRHNRRLRAAQASNTLLATLPRYFIEAVGLALVVVLANVLSSGPGGLAAAIPILGALALGAQRLLPQLQIIYGSWSSYKANQAQLGDVLALATLPLQPKENDLASRGLPRVGLPLIALHDVSFAYAIKESPTLTSINLTINRGERIGFIGKTGCGKSTLIDMVMGLLDPTSGAIEVDGVPLQPQTRRQWQRRIAHVPQSIFLADTTIAKNIAFGTPDERIDKRRLGRVAAMAQLEDFVATLPQGFDTIVGERGVRLSGGQRQRIGLARALYRDTEVLILDEATSALDDATEAAVMQQIDALDGNRTILMIAHRLSTLRHCDRIIELAGGKITNISRPAEVAGI